MPNAVLRTDLRLKLEALSRSLEAMIPLPNAAVIVIRNDGTFEWGVNGFYEFQSAEKLASELAGHE